MSSTKSKKSGLTFTELCSILKLCGESRVAELKFGELAITFHPPVEEGSTFTHLPNPTKQPDAEISDEQRKQLAERSLAIDEYKVKEDQLDHLLIENPTEFENLLAEGELEEEGAAGNEEDGRET